MKIKSEGSTWAAWNEESHQSADCLSSFAFVLRAGKKGVSQRVSQRTSQEGNQVLKPQLGFRDSPVKTVQAGT